MTSRTQLTPAQIAEMRDLCIDGMSIRDLAARFGRSTTTVSNYTLDLRAQPELPPLDVAPDNPKAERWDQRAACRGTDREVFFPTEEDKAGINFAKRICAVCPVTVPCMQEAMDFNLQGIWGGTTDRQRGGMKARARRAAAA